MGEQLIINALYEIKHGSIKGIKGKLVAYDALSNEATIQLEDNLTINTNSENLKLVDERFKENDVDVSGYIPTFKHSYVGGLKENDVEQMSLEEALKFVKENGYTVIKLTKQQKEDIDKYNIYSKVRSDYDR